MARISTYTKDTSINREDLLVGTDVNNSDATKNFSVGDLADFIGTGIQIPTPQMWVYKSGNPNPYQAAGATPLLMQRALCISVPTQFDKRWLDNNPRLFLFRYRTSNTSDGSAPNKRGNYVHPTHLNGGYIQTNFPGSNWCSSPQYNTESGNIYLLSPIVTEWNFNGDLKYVQKKQSSPLTPGIPITDFKTVNSTAYVEVPLNPLQFLYDKDPSQTQVPFTSFPVTINNDLGFRCLLKTGTGQNRFNTNTPWDNPSKSRKAYFKFAIGIPNPTWTNTNKQTPYIMGDLSDAITFQYQSNQGVDSEIQAYQIAQGHSSMISRNVS